MISISDLSRLWLERAFGYDSGAGSSQIEVVCHSIDRNCPDTFEHWKACLLISQQILNGDADV